MMQDKKNLIYCTFFVVLIQLYNIQGFLGLGGLGRWIAVIIIAFSLIKAFQVVTTFKTDPFLKSINLLVLMFTLYWIYYILFGPTYKIYSSWPPTSLSKVNYIKHIYLSILPFYVIYFYAQKGVLTKKVLFSYTIIIFVSSCIAYISFYMGGSTFEESDLTNGYTNNEGYKFAVLLPLFFIIKKWRTPLMIISLILIILSLKRGAIVIGCFCFIAVLWSSMKNNKGLKKIGTIIASLLIVVGASISLIWFYEENKGFKNRIDITLDGYSSGRDEIAKSIVNSYINNQSEVAQIIGEGADATVGIAGNYAHNDWLEILINQGILGVIVYLIFFISWYKSWRNLRHYCPRNVSDAFIVIFIAFAMKTLFSMGYTSFGLATSLIISYCYITAQRNGYMNNSYESRKIIQSKVC